MSLARQRCSISLRPQQQKRNRGASLRSWRVTQKEKAQVLGASPEYKVSEVADRNACIVVKINKDRLQQLKSVEK